VSGPVKCPRCGHVDSFMEGYLSETCVCRVCQSQLDWREIPGMGPDCRPLSESESAGGTPDGSEQAGDAPNPGDAHQES
jgi:hypothetical protein